MNIETAINKLSEYWSVHGCVIHQPHNLQVGAGTNNPATFLRLLDNEPWRCAYIESSIRPADSRHGKSKTRLQRFLQFQVVLKPAPVDIHMLYYNSLCYLYGSDISDRNIAYIADNWKSEPLGAFGKGWEIRIDGLEISQFTLFNRMGGLPCEEAAEITYGVERLCLALSEENDIWNIRWNENNDDEMRYRDLHLQSEIDYSNYYLNVADTLRLEKSYEIYKKEFHNALDEELVYPAYDYLLKCNHAFNIMDARHHVSSFERRRYYQDMFNMAHKCAVAYRKRFVDEGEKRRLLETLSFIGLPEQINNQLFPEGLALGIVGREIECEVGSQYLSLPDEIIEAVLSEQGIKEHKTASHTGLGGYKNVFHGYIVVNYGSPSEIAGARDRYEATINDKLSDIQHFVSIRVF